MTQDFKSILEDYITNNIVPTSQQAKTEFDEADVLSFSHWTSLLPVVPEGHTMNLEFNGYVVDEASNKIIIYGYYSISGSNSIKGIIILLDETFNPIKSFLTYSNGTELNKIECMKQAEDGTFYLVENGVNNVPRFVLVNNFSSQNANGDYVLNFRKNYNFDNSFQSYQIQNMFKSGTSAKYVFFALYEGGNDDYSTKVIELEVNVGEPLVWSTPITISNKRFSGAYAQFSDEGVYWRMLTTQYSSGYDITCYTKDYSQTNPSSTVIATMSYRGYIQDNQKCAFLDQDTVYFSYSLIGTRIDFCKYSFTDSTFTTIFTKSFSGNHYEEINLAICDGILYIQYGADISWNSSSLIPEENGYKGDYYFQRMTDDVWNPVLYAEDETFNYLTTLFIPKTDFNLVQLGSISFVVFATIGTKAYGLLLKDNYNALNYNGQPYTDYNSILPKQVEIYSNNSLVFARNIIDKTVIDNKTVSTTTIPNTYLNNINLDKENLLTETNVTMLSQNVPITKNIYESIYLSFINSITNRIYGVDSQTIEAQVPSNLNSYVNTNMNTGTQTNSENTSMGCLVVNYADGTTLTNNVLWTRVNGQYQYTFALDVQKEIASYEIKSSNLQQTYYTVIPSGLNVGSIYKITETFYVS